MLFLSLLHPLSNLLHAVMCQVIHPHINHAQIPLRKISSTRFPTISPFSQKSEVTTRMRLIGINIIPPYTLVETGGHKSSSAGALDVLPDGVEAVVDVRRVVVVLVGVIFWAEGFADGVHAVEGVEDVEPVVVGQLLSIWGRTESRLTQRCSLPEAGPHIRGMNLGTWSLLPVQRWRSTAIR